MKPLEIYSSPVYNEPTKENKAIPIVPSRTNRLNLIASFSLITNFANKIMPETVVALTDPPTISMESLGAITTKKSTKRSIGAARHVAHNPKAPANESADREKISPIATKARQTTRQIEDAFR